jgi:hypothetical protein
MEISQDPKLNIRLARGRWLEVAVAAVLIAAAALAVLTSRGGGRPPSSPRAGPVRRRPRRCSHQPCHADPAAVRPAGGMTILGSTAWISDWSSSQIAGVDLAAGRVTRIVAGRRPAG